MPDTYTCPRCGRTSHNPHDARYRYCGAADDAVVELEARAADMFDRLTEGDQ